LKSRFDEAAADAEKAIAIGSDVGATVAVRFAVTLLGFAALCREDYAEVDRQLAPVCATGPVDGLFDPGLVRFIPDQVEALLALGRHDEADALLEPFERQAIALDRPSARAASARCRAIQLESTTDPSAAIAAIEGALSLRDSLNMPFDRARTQLWAGSILRRARQRREARANLEQALREFTRLDRME
jgi:tetratricopeptide (TPR) repeat protein